MPNPEKPELEAVACRFGTMIPNTVGYLPRPAIHLNEESLTPLPAAQALLAERDARIAELEARLARWRKVARAAVEAMKVTFNSEGQWSGNDPDIEMCVLADEVAALSEEDRAELLEGGKDG